MRLKPICIIPAREGSKGVIGKNIRKLGDKPLIAYAIQSAINSNLFSHVIVTTDSVKIAEVAKNYNAEVPFMRPKELASDFTTMSDTLLHVIKGLKKKYEFDTIVYRDCTCPFIDKDDIRGSLNLFYSSDCDAVYTGVIAHPNPYFGMGELGKDGYLVIPKSTSQEINRRQDAPIVYNLDGMVVLDSKEFEKSKKMFTCKSIQYEISKEHGHMIDSEFDFKIAELICENRDLFNSM
tara:strand:- start:2512 stop:3219 length:708 start_codon:yes stop_codon:yes gene_type:complete